MADALVPVRQSRSLILSLARRNKKCCASTFGFCVIKSDVSTRGEHRETRQLADVCCCPRLLSPSISLFGRRIVCKSRLPRAWICISDGALAEQQRPFCSARKRDSCNTFGHRESARSQCGGEKPLSRRSPQPTQSLESFVDFCAIWRFRKIKIFLWRTRINLPTPSTLTNC